MNIKSNSFFYFFIMVVLFLIVVLQYQLWFSSTGVFKYSSINKSVKAQTVEVDDKTLTNNQLYSEVVSLRRNSEVLESLARQNMGFIKKGEVFYSVK